MQMCFFVHEGKVMVEVGGQGMQGEVNTFAISKGGVWVVPRGEFTHSLCSIFSCISDTGTWKPPPPQTRKNPRWMAERAVTHRHTPRTEDENFQRLKAARLDTSRSIFWLPISCCEPLFSRRNVRRCMRMTRCQHTRGQDYALCALGNIVRSFDGIAPREPSSNVAHNAVPRTPFALTRDTFRLQGLPDWLGRRAALSARHVVRRAPKYVPAFEFPGATGLHLFVCDFGPRCQPFISNYMFRLTDLQFTQATITQSQTKAGRRRPRFFSHKVVRSMPLQPRQRRRRRRRRRRDAANM